MAARYPDRDRALALAGLLQAAYMAQSLAWRGEVDERALRASLGSLFVNDPRTTADVFGGSDGVRLGLRLVREKFGSGGEPQDVELARYALALTQLAGRLRANPPVMAVLETGLARLAQAAQDGELAPLAEGLADLYSETLSTLPPRILVNGEPAHLHDAATVARIRAALLAGVRAADLWHQVDGRQWQLVFQRKRFAKTAAAILEEREDRESLN